MHYYCTLFDRNYFSRGLALYHSLVRHGGDFVLAVLCLDVPTQEALHALRLPGIEVVSIEAIETWDRELAIARGDRTNAEYYFTCKPVLLQYLTERSEGAARITYLDSDLYFFSSPAESEKEYVHSSVALAPHRFPPRLARLERVGRFNAGWLSVSTGTVGRKFLEWWRARCIEWCRWEVEETRYGDQKYLDRVPALFEDVVSVTHPGVNAAPWNIDASRVEPFGQSVRLEGRPLVVYHFHGMRQVMPRLYDSGLCGYGVPLTPVVRDRIYRPYLSELVRCHKQTIGLPVSVRARLNPVVVSSVRGGLLRRLKLLARLLWSRTALIRPLAVP